MNPRMDEVSKAVRAVFPLVDGKKRYRSGWMLTLVTAVAGSIAVALDNPAYGHLTFVVKDTDDPTAKVESAAGRFAKRCAA